jgi:hypothetical protein
MGPFTVLACPAPNTYRLALPAAWRAPPALPLPPRRASVVPAPTPHPPRCRMLKFKKRYGRPHVLVRWAGRDASGDTREPLDRRANCEEAIAAFERATGRSLPRPAAAPPAVPGAPPAPIRVAPAGFIGRGRAGGRPGRGLGAGGPRAPLLVALRRVAARHGRSPLPPRRLLARRGLLAADLGAARHGGLAARRRLLRPALGPLVPRRRRRGRTPPPVPPRPGPPTLTFSLVGGPSRLGSRRWAGPSCLYKQ